MRVELVQRQYLAAFDTHLGQDLSILHLVVSRHGLHLLPTSQQDGVDTSPSVSCFQHHPHRSGPATIAKALGILVHTANAGNPDNDRISLIRIAGYTFSFTVLVTADQEVNGFTIQQHRLLHCVLHRTDIRAVGQQDAVALYRQVLLLLGYAVHYDSSIVLQPLRQIPEDHLLQILAGEVAALAVQAAGFRVITIHAANRHHRILRQFIDPLRLIFRKAHAAFHHAPAQLHLLADAKHTVQAVAAQQQLHIADLLPAQNLSGLLQLILHPLTEHIRGIMVQHFTPKPTHRPLCTIMAVSNAQHQSSLANSHPCRGSADCQGRHFLHRPNDRIPQRFAAGLSPVGFIDFVSQVTELLDVFAMLHVFRILRQHPGVSRQLDARAHLSQMIRVHAAVVFFSNLRPIKV